MNRLRNMQSGLRSSFRNIRKLQKKTSMAFFRKRLESYLPMFWKMQEYTNVRPREEKHSCVFLKHYKNWNKRILWEMGGKWTLPCNPWSGSATGNLWPGIGFKPREIGSGWICAGHFMEPETLGKMQLRVAVLLGRSSWTFLRKSAWSVRKYSKSAKCEINDDAVFLSVKEQRQNIL